ncbi:metallophosphoesterase family protein [Lysinibacillus piscis]|uniref:Calcineurin-like phosphoesterase domain-containing protein n=1 Tax=Lysinibacillus piscis TaxID=2518931 RepID=A0ABQ5NQP6_9BACI|nr:metallophosphatase family protein [Lysinibacillus sp. KH24]GLC90349.1 hypothetical protein LYSBPC_34760 [Lysinibacillus sp. KH24]
MLYALLGDLHSNIEDTTAVLTHIQEVAADATILGLGDLYECTIGKKKAQTVTNIPLEQAAIVQPDFEKLLTFPSIRGNQEERITLVTGIERFSALPEMIHIEGATLIHGHQFHWNTSWQPTFPAIQTNLLFFGHSHESAIYQHNNKLPTNILFGQPIAVENKAFNINVGSVVYHREWCLYDSDKQTITFMRVNS